MTGPGIQVDPDALASSGSGLERVAAEFGQALAAFQQELAGFGQPWGGDDIGSLIGAAHEAVAEFAFDCFGTAVDEIGAAGVDLGAMASTYREVEERIRGSFQALQQGFEG
ncbi:WXG100 family type VII secretion target [Micromonospora tarensis]|uniref:WXG100 family type VII secretion target n=1 Tax=Micromonospora tarensis TaxID=2806100 RepID=UPI002814C4F7|nr:hypothetical protein [Micromonospora tarensis]